MFNRRIPKTFSKSVLIVIDVFGLRVFVNGKCNFVFHSLDVFQQYLRPVVVSGVFPRF